MLNKLVWVFLLVIAFGLSTLFLSAPMQQAGDIAEYFGTSQSILNHGSVNLTVTDQAELEKSLHAAYFQDPGYYISGRGGERYPVHFVFYSVLLIPVRLVLQLFEFNQIYALALTNLLLFLLALIFIFAKWVKNPFSRLAITLILLVSPLAFFISWPGPDLYYALLVLIALYFFGDSKYLLASIVAALASWHSQPLLIFSFAFALAYFKQQIKAKKIRGKMQLNFSPSSLSRLMLPAFLLVVPYGYNLWAFGVLTPWTIFQNGWTQLNGFGLQNIALHKLYEQFFDFNVGLFWYAPLIVVFGLFFFLLRIKKQKDNFFLFVVMLLTALFYQTNPAWHFGTAGYGPTRHILFALPFFAYWIARNVRAGFGGLFVVFSILLTQLLVLSTNGWFLPNFENTLRHSPLAQYVLQNHPTIYNPTPELFVDRTNHTDLDRISSAVYKNAQGVCVKAYILKTDVEKIEEECGELNKESKEKLENEFLRKASYTRDVVTTEATFWPHSDSCESWYLTDANNPYQCIKSQQDFIKLVGPISLDRFHQVEDYAGVWRLKPGLPVRISVPPGYIIHHSSFDGAYVNF